MKHERENTFADRRDTALSAKKKLLERIKSAPKPDQAELDRKRAEKEATAAAREIRQAEQLRAKEVEAERKLAEAAALIEAEAQARIDAELETVKAAENEAAQEVERKEDRDRRYAARKARKR